MIHYFVTESSVQVQANSSIVCPVCPGLGGSAAIPKVTREQSHLTARGKIHAGISFLFSGSNGQTGILLLPTLLSIPTSHCHQLVVRSRKFASSGSSASQYTEMIIWSHFQGNTSLYWEFFRSSYADSTCIAAYVDCMIPPRAYVLVN